MHNSYEGGVWHGSTVEVICCGKCAVEVLPRLMADSVRFKGRPHRDGIAAWEKAKTNYWKAMACRMSSKG